MNRISLTRRAAFLGMGALSVVSVVPVALAARRETTVAVPPTPEQRLQNAAAEMRAAMKDLNAGDYMIVFREFGGLSLAFAMEFTTEGELIRKISFD